jgi:hypothetical protein
MTFRRILLAAVLAGSLSAVTRSRGAQSPSFTLQPQNQTVVAGNDANFSVAAGGAAPMSYQWWFNGSILSGQTNTNLSLVNVTVSNSGSYWVSVTNSHGGIVSSNAVLTVGYPPVLVKQPVSQAALLNSNLQFSVTASGSAPLAYQWRLNGESVPSATDFSLPITAMQPSRSGAYTVVVTNAYGAVTSDTATLSVAAPPEFLWARRVTNTVNGYTGTSYGKNLAIDGSGNVFVVGYYNGWGVDFGGAILTNNSANAMAASFVCKYDQWGNFQWVRQFSTNGFPALRVATDGGGNVYVTGDYQGFATFGTNILFSSNARFIFLAKYDTDGQVLWSRSIAAYDPAGGSSGRGFTVDNAGNTFLVATYQGTAYFDTTNLSGSAAFMAKYGTGGNLAWVKGVSPATSICVANSGTIYTCSLLLTKYDNVGNQIWSRPFPAAQCMVLDGAENIYASGSGNGVYGDLTVTNVSGISDFFAAKCDSAGNLVWSRQLGSTKQQAGTTVALDNFTNLYVGSISASAQREPSLSFGGSTLTNVMGLLLKYDAAGNPLWAKALGGTNRASAAGLRALNSGKVVMAGTFYGSAQFDSFSLNSGNQTALEDMYVAAAAGIETPAPPLIIAPPKSQVARVGSTVSFTVTTAPSGMPQTYQWFFNGTNQLQGGTASALVFTNLGLSDSGSYLVNVANGYGSVTSSPATLTVYLTEAATLTPGIGTGTNPIQFYVAGVPGLQYAIEASTNLVDWLRLQTNVSEFLFSDTPGQTYSQRFYRAVWIP